MTSVIRTTRALAALAALALGVTIAGGEAAAEKKRYCRQEYCAKREPVVCTRKPGVNRRVCSAGRCLLNGVRVVECGAR